MGQFDSKSRYVILYMVCKDQEYLTPTLSLTDAKRLIKWGLRDESLYIEKIIYDSEKGTVYKA